MTDDELLMKLADLGNPEALAEAIVSHYPNFKIPADLNAIATAVGIVEIVESDSASFEGLLVTDRAKTVGSIAYRANGLPERARLTIAHELGHFLIPTHGDRAQCGKQELGTMVSANSVLSKEVEANRFAVSLLMPKKIFLRAMRDFGSPETEHIPALGRRFGVSKEAAGRRFAELTDHACAIVFSENSTVRYSVCSAAMPQLIVRKGDPLPADSISGRARLSEGTMSDWTDAEQGWWLRGDGRRTGRCLSEQCLAQQNGFRLTMLTLDEVAEEEAEEHEALEDSWTPRFRR